MASNLCSVCVTDPFLRKIVQREGTPGQCAECNKRRGQTITTARLGNLLEPILRANFVEGPDVPHFYDDDDKEYSEQAGDDLGFIIQEVLNQSFSCNEEIVQAVIDAECCDPRDGDIPLFTDTTNYVPSDPSDSAEVKEWARVQHELMRTRRFFCSSAKTFFDRLFKDVDGILTHHGPSVREERVVSKLPKGSIIYRSRVCDDIEQIRLALQDPFRHVGPPPPEKARAGRMNAEGILTFYGATDIETCLAELRPALGGEAATIALQITQPVRMLDLPAWLARTNYSATFNQILHSS